ncbi:MAG: hypothetical protein ACPGQS_04820 [Bradymonadia bacterium]
MVFRALFIVSLSVCTLSGPVFASPNVTVSAAKPTLKVNAKPTKRTKIVHPLLVRVKDARKKLKQPPKALKGFDLSGAMRASK